MSAEVCNLLELRSVPGDGQEEGKERTGNETGAATGGCPAFPGTGLRHPQKTG